MNRICLLFFLINIFFSNENEKKENLDLRNSDITIDINFGNMFINNSFSNF